jgi:hypothetical protein
MPTSIRVIEREEALQQADKQSVGSARARDVANRFADAGMLHWARFEESEREAFLDIAWQENNDGRYLTRSCSRTLRSVAVRVFEEFGTFRDLVSAAPIPDEFNPSWFRSCSEIEDEGWAWAKFQPWLVPAMGTEKRCSVRTQLYPWEGVRSSLVLALGLLTCRVPWQPFDAIICEERPPD